MNLLFGNLTELGSGTKLTFGLIIHASIHFVQFFAPLKTVLKDYEFWISKFFSDLKRTLVYFEWILHSYSPRAIHQKVKKDLWFRCVVFKSSNFLCGFFLYFFLIGKKFKGVKLVIDTLFMSGSLRLTLWHWWIERFESWRNFCRRVYKYCSKSLRDSAKSRHFYQTIVPKFYGGTTNLIVQREKWQKIWPIEGI